LFARRYAKERVQAELDDSTDQLAKEEEAQVQLAAKIASLRREVEESKAEVAAAKAAAEAEAAAGVAASATAVGGAASARLVELEGLLEAREKELAEMHEK
jgi:hypothetical protein